MNTPAAQGKYRGDSKGQLGWQCHCGSGRAGALICPGALAHPAQNVPSQLGMLVAECQGWTSQEYKNSQGTSPSTLRVLLVEGTTSGAPGGPIHYTLWSLFHPKPKESVGWFCQDHNSRIAQDSRVSICLEKLRQTNNLDIIKCIINQMPTLISWTSSRERQEQPFGTVSKLCCQNWSCGKIINVIVPWLVHTQGRTSRTWEIKHHKYLLTSVQIPQISGFTFLSTLISEGTSS